MDPKHHLKRTRRVRNLLDRVMCGEDHGLMTVSMMCGEDHGVSNIDM